MTHEANGTSTDNSTTSPAASDRAMKIPISPQRATHLSENISSVFSRISSSPRPSPSPSSPVRLVAVSKLKPVSDILALHQSPTSHLHFGENYVQELVEKSKLLPTSIRWHFIGGLQSNKCQQLAREVPSLWAVESVDSVKKANLLNKGRAEALAAAATGDADETQWEPLRVFVQVNTSGEESKSGVAPLPSPSSPSPSSPSASDELLVLCKHVHSAELCPHLRLQGLMTIGAIARSKATTPETENEDFECLRACRNRVAAELHLEHLELSMGMSEDFEAAIRMGSDEVRVGSTIFGERPAKKDAKVL